jgi:hypothetical protein
VNARVYILFPGREVWRLGAGDGRAAAKLTDVAITADAEPRAIAGAVTAALKAQGYRGEGVLLAIESSMCLCAPVRTDGLPTKQRRRAMTYRMEEKLPIAAEDVVADFIEGGPAAAVDAEALGICVRRTALTPVVEALEESGVAVAAICPASLLALQHLMRDGRPLATPQLPDAVVWPNAGGEQLELFVLREGRLHGWYVFPNRAKDLLMHVAMASPSVGTLVAIGLEPGLCTALAAARSELQVRQLAATAPTTPASSLAAAVLDGKVIPWIDLRRDALAVRDPFRQVRAPLTVAAAAVVLCLICLCAAMLWRANRYDAMADRLADQQQAAFRQALPTGLVPPDVRSRLEAEERRLRGLSGDDSAPPAGEGGLVTLRDLITHLPADRDVRYRVLEVRLDQNRFALEGQATAHGDADSIVASLKRGGAFVVDPPRTEQLVSADDNASGVNRGVAFTITGAAINGASPAARRAGK